MSGLKINWLILVVLNLNFSCLNNSEIKSHVLGSEFCEVLLKIYKEKGDKGRGYNLVLSSNSKYNSKAFFECYYDTGINILTVVKEEDYPLKTLNLHINDIKDIDQNQIKVSIHILSPHTAIGYNVFYDKTKKSLIKVEDGDIIMN